MRAKIPNQVECSFTQTTIKKPHIKKIILVIKTLFDLFEWNRRVSLTR